MSDPKRGSCAFKTVGVAYAAAHYDGSDFVGSIMDIIQHGGDTVGNAMVTGGVIGIKLGFLITFSLDARHERQDWFGRIVDNFLAVLGLKE